MQWITARLRCFDPLPSGKADRRGLKAFGELSILYLFARETSAGLSADHTDQVALTAFLDEGGSFIRACCARPGFAEVARREPLLGYLCVLPYMVLRATGIYLSSMEDVLKWLAQFGLPGSVETIPYRELDRQYFLWKGGLVPRGSNWNRILAQTVLGSRRGLLYCDRDEAYSITHTLIYLTDFGKEPQALPQAMRRRTALLLDSLIVHYWRLENWDLLGELLMSVYLLHLPESAMLQAAAASLDKQVDESGSLPASTWERRREQRRHKQRAGPTSPDTMDTYTLDRYHPTFVRALYWLARLNAEAQQVIA